MPINLLSIIDFLQETFNCLITILLNTMSIVPMDVHHVGECLEFNFGITNIVLGMLVTDGFEEGFIRNTDSLRPNQFKVCNEALPSPTIPALTLSLVVFVIER